MPKTKAIVIPDWVTAIKKDQKLEDTLLNYLPAMMHWRNVDWMVAQLVSFTPQTAIRVQMRDVVEHMKVLLKQEGVKEDLVACVAPLKNIPYHLMVSLAPDVETPIASGQMVLRVDIHGDIVEIEREYTMKYSTDKS